MRKRVINSWEKFLEKHPIYNKRGRWGTIHWRVVGFDSLGDYQKPGANAFDSKEDALRFLKKEYIKFKETNEA